MEDKSFFSNDVIQRITSSYETLQTKTIRFNAVENVLNPLICCFTLNFCTIPF